MMDNKYSTPDIFETVVANGMCIGCGTCAAFDPNIRIKFDEYGRYIATRKTENGYINPSANRVCPFADQVPNENILALEIFGNTSPYDPNIGYHKATYAGWVIESDFRESGSSGGLASWLLTNLLNRSLVDYVVHITSEPNPAEGKPLFRFAISSTSDEICARAKSRYYPVEMSEVIEKILTQPGRYAVVGIPCFIKSLRLASHESSILKERLIFTIGIVCGHLKSTAFAEYFAWQCGIEPTELRGIDFRTKIADSPASSYAVTVTGEKGGKIITVTKPTSELFGSNWGHGFFKYKACDFCDDVVGETADISIGDAWLKEYEWNSAGTNVVVVRSELLNDILTDGANKGLLQLDTLTAEKVIESQAGGLRHRREGLAYRLWLEDEAGRWRPKKRITPSFTHLSPKLRNIYSLRYKLGQESHYIFADTKERQELGFFRNTIKPLTDRYDAEYRRPLSLRLLGKIKRSIVSVTTSFLVKINLL